MHKKHILSIARLEILNLVMNLDHTFINVITLLRNNFFNYGKNNLILDNIL